MNFIELFKNIDNVQAATTTVGFNACHYAGANLAQVKVDKEKLAEYFGVAVSNIYIPRQTHSTNVAMPGEDLNDIDAMVCNVKDIVIAVNTADCLPLLLADVNANVIAAVHCGWRGTVAGIVKNALNKMVALGACAPNIVASMGPCIGVECFEVGDEVAAQFQNETICHRYLDRKTRQYISYAKPHVDLAKAVTLQLTNLGVNKDNIVGPIACSMCDDRFYSVRREGRTLPFRTLTAIKIR